MPRRSLAPLAPTPSWETDSEVGDADGPDGATEFDSGSGSGVDGTVESTSTVSTNTEGLCLHKVLPVIVPVTCPL